MYFVVFIDRFVEELDVWVCDRGIEDYYGDFMNVFLVVIFL